MKKIHVLKRLGVLGAVAWLAGASTGRSEEGPPPLPEVGLYLNGFRFDDTNHWWSTRETGGQGWTNVQSVPSWHTNAARLAGSGPSYLSYRVFETNGLRNIYPDRGSVWMWIRPLWSTTNGGLGYSARLLEMGEFNSPDGWWSLHVGPQGDRIIFAGSSNGVGSVYLESPPVQFVSNRWTHLVLNYTATNSFLYTNGVLATNGSGVSYWPSDSVLSNGFFIGSDRYGSNLAQADFEWMRTYDGPAVDYYLSHYTNTLRKIEEWENGGGGEGLMGDGGGDGLMVDDGGGGSLGPGSGCTNGIQFVNPPVWMGTNLLLSLCGGVTNGVYDLYFITNLNPTRVWTFVGRSETPGQTGFLVSGLPMPTGFFALGLTNDWDGDGMSDAWEGLVSHTQTNVAQPPFKAFITGVVGAGGP